MKSFAPIIVLFGLVVICVATPPWITPTLQSFDWEAKGSYVAYGSTQNADGINANQPAQQAIFAIDTVNKAFFIDLGSGGQYWGFQNGTFIIIPALSPNCTYTPPNYDFQISQYKTVRHTDSLKEKGGEKVNIYTGNPIDFGSCGQYIGVTMKTTASSSHSGAPGYIKSWDFGHPFFIDTGSFILRLNIVGWVHFTHYQPINNFNRHLLRLPGNCLISNLQSYCSTFKFPTTNINY